MTAHLAGIFRYPVKGLSPERMDDARLERGETLPFDRAYAIENGPSRFDPFAPAHVSKVSFLTLMRNPRLAELSTTFDGPSATLSIARESAILASGDLSTPTGRAVIAQFFAEFLRDELRGAPKVVHAPGHSISDVAAKCLHLINLETVRELERVLGATVAPERFRANLWITGVPPWSELSWPGKRINIGQAELEVFKVTERCAATNVDPARGVRDLDIPAALLRQWGHSNFGVYARVVAGAPIRVGAPVSIQVV